MSDVLQGLNDWWIGGVGADERAMIDNQQRAIFARQDAEGKIDPQTKSSMSMTFRDLSVAPTISDTMLSIWPSDAGAVASGLASKVANEVALDFNSLYLLPGEMARTSANYAQDAASIAGTAIGNFMSPIVTQETKIAGAIASPLKSLAVLAVAGIGIYLLVIASPYVKKARKR